MSSLARLIYPIIAFIGVLMSWDIFERNRPLGASIGCAFAPDEGADFVNLYKKADKALYFASDLVIVMERIAMNWESKDISALCKITYETSELK